MTEKGKERVKREGEREQIGWQGRGGLWSVRRATVERGGWG